MVSPLATTLTLTRRPLSFLFLYRETNAGSQLIQRRSLVTDWISLAKKPWFRIFYVGTELSRHVSHVQLHHIVHNHIDINMQYLPAYWFLCFRCCWSIIIWDRLHLLTSVLEGTLILNC